MKTMIAPSLLGADFSKLGENIKTLVESGITTLHLDIMDGHFVPNISFGVEVIKMLRTVDPNIEFDAHLMVEDPDMMIDQLAVAGVNAVTVHSEACKHLYRTLEKIKKLGMQTGVALNPSTDFSVLEYVVKASVVDKVLIMTVEPGFGGQKFIPMSLVKIANLHKWRDKQGGKFTIQIDGGVTMENINDTIKAGAEKIVIGSSLFKEAAIKRNIKNFFDKISSATSDM
jgi:ribulose-phosphate 3-epimerase